MELRIKAWNPKPVTARSLSRNIGQLLNELEDTGTAMVVLRFGRPAAMLVPLERSAPRRSVAMELVEDQPAALPKLDDSQRTLLAEMARRAPEPYHPDEWTGKIEKFIHASLGLEMNGLIAKDGGGRRWLTAEGEQAAAKIAV